MKLARGYCKECNGMRKIEKETRSGALDILAIVFTMGIWLIFMMFRSSKKWTCSICGGTKIKKKLFS